MKTEHSRVDQKALRGEMLAGLYGEAASLSAAFLNENAIWHRLATNSAATSCRDASARRWRLGKEGIGLHNELKTVAFTGTDITGELLVLAHCNADFELDEDRIAVALCLVSAVQKADLSSQLGDMYGLVNPFNFASLMPGTRVRQIFDLFLIERPPLSQTMMTNGGDRSIGVEFRVRDIVGALGGAAMVESIAHRVIEPVRKLTFLSGGDGYAAFRFAKVVQDCANEALGVRAGTGLGAIPMDVRIIPGLAATKAIRDYSEIIADAIPSAVESEIQVDTLIVPCTLGVEAALRTENRNLNLFELSDCILSDVADRPIAGAKNDFDSLALLHEKFVFDKNKHLAFDFIEDLDYELGVKMSSLNITQKMYETFGNKKLFQTNINLWYYMHELSGNRAQNKLGPNVRHLHDVAARKLAQRILESHT